MMKSLEISSGALSRRLEAVAQQINADYAIKNLHIISVLKGTCSLTADLIRFLKVPFHIDFIQCSPIGLRGSHMRVEGLNPTSLVGKDVLLAHDVLEIGEVLYSIATQIKQCKPSSLKTLVLLQKTLPEPCRIQADYTLFNIQDRHTVKYGLDYKGPMHSYPSPYSLT